MLTMKDTHSIDRLPEDVLWQQVLTRQAEGTVGDFLYAVMTMGVYCRPACPSPRPLRKNVRFFHTCSEAEAAGFRACKRCDPKGERARIAQEVVRDACAYMEAAEEIPSLETLAQTVRLFRFHFLRMFRDHAGLTPRSYAEGVRARRLHAALAEGTASPMRSRALVSAPKAGCTETGSLLGMTPGAARRGGEGEVIRAAFADCPFGRLLVGATDKGVCFIGFAEPDEALLGDMRRRFPRAKVALDDSDAAARCGRCSTSLKSRSGRSTCRWIPGARRFSSASGKRFAESPWGTGLCATGGNGWRTESGSGGGRILRHEPCVAGGSLSQGSRERWWPDRLSLGCAAQAGSAGPGTKRRGRLERFRAECQLENAAALCFVEKIHACARSASRPTAGGAGSVWIEAPNRLWLFV